MVRSLADNAGARATGDRSEGEELAAKQAWTMVAIWRRERTKAERRPPTRTKDVGSSV